MIFVNKLNLFRYGDKYWEEHDHDIDNMDSEPIKIKEESKTDLVPESVHESIHEDVHEEIKYEQQQIFHKCTQCEESFQTVTELSQHQKIVHEKIQHKFQCTVCDLICPNKSKLKTHIEEVHEKKKVPCPQCNKLFSKGGLRNHIKYFHDVDRVSKPFKCSECDFASHALKYLKGTIHKPRGQYLEVF